MNDDLFPGTSLTYKQITDTIIDRYWLRSVQRIAMSSIRQTGKSSIIMYPPTQADYDDAIDVLRKLTMPNETKIAIAGGGDGQTKLPN